MNTDPAAYTLGYEEGEAFSFFGGLVTVKASARQTGERYSADHEVRNTVTKGDIFALAPGNICRQILGSSA